MNYKILLLLAASLAILPGCNWFKPSPEKAEAKIQWTYGGFKGEKCTCVGDGMIKDLHASGDNMSYSWAVPQADAVKLLGSKGVKEADLLACYFVTTKSGDIVGGKFEWISVSRTTRNFKNIKEGYSGWTLSNVPNPDEVYFCIANPKTYKRTNFIKGTWKR